MKLNNTLKTLLFTASIAAAGTGCQSDKAWVEIKTKQELVDNNLAEEQEMSLNDKLAKEREDAEREKIKNQEIERSHINIDWNASMDSVLENIEIVGVNNLLNNLGSTRIDYQNAKWERFRVSSSSTWLVYSWASIEKITFTLIEQNVHDWILWRAEILNPLEKEGRIVLNFYQIKRVVDIAKEIWVQLSVEDVLKMAFREESSHLRGNRWERANETLLMQTLPEKFGIVKAYIMLRTMGKREGGLTGGLTKSYKELFKKYQSLMKSVWCSSYEDVNLQQLYEMVQKLRTGEFS